MTAPSDALRALPPGDVAVVGVELESSPLLALLRQRLPGARIFSVGGPGGAQGLVSLPRRRWLAVLALRQWSPKVFVAAQDYQALKLLGLASGAREKLVFRNGQFDPIEAWPIVRGMVRRARAPRAVDPRTTRKDPVVPKAPRLGLADLERIDPGPLGPGNDYRFIRSRPVARSIPADLRAVTPIVPSEDGRLRFPSVLEAELISVRSGLAAEAAPISEAALGWLRRDLRSVVLAAPRGDGPMEREFREAVASTRALVEHPHPEQVAALAGGFVFSSAIFGASGWPPSAWSAETLAVELAQRGAYFIPEPSLESGGSSLPKALDSTATRPRVSVYIPAYNSGQFIERAIRSALAQTMPALEVCVCDDGSTDDTAEVIARLAREDPRVRFVSQPNAGISAASNAAVAMCRADYVLQLDADDELLPDAASILAARLDADPGMSLVYGGFEVVDPSAQLYQQRQVIPGPYDRFAALHGNVATHPRMFRKRDFSRTSGFDESLENAVDFDIYLKLAEQGRVGTEARVLYRYYIHGGNTSVAKRALQFRNHIRVIRAAFERRNINWQIVQPDPNNLRKVEFRSPGN